MPTPRAVLWDLDNTLIDSGEHHYEAWRQTTESLGHAMDRGTFAASFGKKNDTILRELLGVDADAAEIDRIGEEKEVIYRRLLRERGIELLPGAAQWLERLKGGGWRQALATSAPRANVDVVLARLGLDGFFDGEAVGEDVVSGKPDPAIFLEAARRVGALPADCIVVEDAPGGLLGARRAGMRSIGVLSSHFSALEADLVVHSLTELPADAFDRLSRR
jgi:HAD superfamily hydrolase (TIGR01509 family)